MIKARPTSTSIDKFRLSFESLTKLDRIGSTTSITFGRDIINTKMLYHLFLLAVLFTASECWVLKVSDHVVARKITTNVLFNCYYDWNDNGEPRLEDVYEIRILKFKSADQWDTVARVSVGHAGMSSTLRTINHTRDLSGMAGSPTDSYLKFKFPIATTETVGKFKCDIGGFGQTTHTDPVVVKERGINYDDILNILDDMKKVEKKDHSSEQSQINLMKESLDLVTTKQTSIGDELQDVKTSLSTISKDVLALKRG